MNSIKREKLVLDAENKIMGRIATAIAMHLMGKTRVDYRANIDMGGSVEVLNISKMKLSGKKLEKKLYQRPTPYIGHLKTIQLKHVFPTKPDWVLKKAVYRMLPKNKLRDQMIKRLHFKN
jgi:large subunit ribosomal protein L13